MAFRNAVAAIVATIVRIVKPNGQIASEYGASSLLWSFVDTYAINLNHNTTLVGDSSIEWSQDGVGKYAETVFIGPKTEPETVRPYLSTRVNESLGIRYIDTHLGVVDETLGFQGGLHIARTSSTAHTTLTLSSQNILREDLITGINENAYVLSAYQEAVSSGGYVVPAVAAGLETLVTGLTSTYQAPTMNGSAAYVLDVDVSVDVTCTVAGVSILVFYLYIDGVPQTDQLLTNLISVVGDRSVFTKHWQVILPGDGALHTIEIRSRKTVAVGTHTVGATHSTLKHKLGW